MSTTPMSPEVFRQTEFRDYKDHAVWFYICTNSDMAGILPFRVDTVMAALKMRRAMLLGIIKHFESVGLIEIGPTEECIWVIGKCDWTLYSGKAQQKQFDGVSKRLRKWSKPNRMGTEFAEHAREVVAAQHGFTIPLPKPPQTLRIKSESKSESKSETKSDLQDDVDNFEEEEPKKKYSSMYPPLVQDEIDSIKMMLENSPCWDAVPKVATDQWIHGLMEKYRYPDRCDMPNHVSRAIQGLINHWRQQNLPPMKAGQKHRIEAFIAKHDSKQQPAGFKKIGGVM